MLSHVIFFVCGFIKHCVHANKVNTKEELIERIRGAFVEIYLKLMLCRVWAELVLDLIICELLMGNILKLDMLFNMLQNLSTLSLFSL